MARTQVNFFHRRVSSRHRWTGGDRRLEVALGSGALIKLIVWRFSKSDFLGRKSRRFRIPMRQTLISLIKTPRFSKNVKSAEQAVFMRVREGFCGRSSKDRCS